MRSTHRAWCNPVLGGLLAALAAACEPGPMIEVRVPASDAVPFAVDAVPAAVNASPLQLTGSKPAGSAIHVDGSPRSAASPASRWSLALDLVEGDNRFELSAHGPSGQLGATIAVTVVLDVLAPTVVSQTPAPSATAVALNTDVVVVFSEAIDCSTLTAAVFSIQGVATSLRCDAGGTSATLEPDADLAAQTRYTVLLYSDVTDLAGNRLGADVIWQFTTGDAADTTPPPPPTADNPAPPASTALASVTVGGSKEAGSSVLVNDVEVVPRDATTRWSWDFALVVGVNSFALRSEDAAGNRSVSTTDFTITRSAGGFGVDPYPALVNSTPLTLTGSKPNAYGVQVDGQPRVPADASTVWSLQLDLVEGANSAAVAPVDPAGNAGAAVAVSVTLDTVPPAAPTADAPAPPAFSLSDQVTVGGSKDADSAVLANAVEIVAADASTTWRHLFALVAGSNSFSLTARDRAGNTSTGSTDFSIDRSSGSFAIDSHPTLVTASPLTLTGSKPAGYGVAVDGSTRVSPDAQTTWSLQLALSEGANSFDLAPVDPGNTLGAALAVAITLDTTPPGVVSRSPDDGETGVAINTNVTVVLDEAADCATVDSTSFAIAGVAAVVSCDPGTRALTLDPASDLAAGTRYDVTLAATVTDLAGLPLPAAVNWSFTTGAGVDLTPPPPPSADNPAPPRYTMATAVSVGGSKEAGSSVLANSVEVVARSGATTWSHSFALAIGDNTIDLTSADAAGNVSTTATSFTVTRSAGSFAVNSYPALVGASPQAVSGSKPNAYGVAVDGVEQIAPNGATTWNLALPLGEGPNSFELAQTDPTGVVGSPVTVNITLDTTPPPPPSADNPAPTSPTTAGTMTVGGSKEAGAAVEMRWLVNSVLQQDWTVIVAAGAATSWSHVFSLNLGQNDVALRARDAMGYPSATTTSFTIQRNSAVAAPTLDPVVNPTTVGNQVLRGGKPANTAIYNIASGSPVLLVPLDAATRWDALVQLGSGDNRFELVARNGSGVDSAPAAAQTITYNPPGNLPAGGELKISFELRDLWDLIGDEFNAGAGGDDVNHFAVDVWIEGPITPGESCVFDSARKQRRHSRYVASVVHNCPLGGTPAPPAACYGWWWEPDFRSPNLLAALIEAGWWESTNHPIPRDVQRRDPSTGQMWPPGMNGTTPLHPELYYRCVQPECPFAPAAGNSKPRMFTRLVDGMTEASIDSGQGSGGGAALGSWTSSRVYRWNLRDYANQPLPRGPYLVQVTVNVDRRAPDLALIDRETCWDNPAHASTGINRAEGIVVLGSGSTTLYLHERSGGVVNACNDTNGTDYLLCNCGASTTWPCPETPIASNLIGSPVEMLTPDRFSPGDGSSYAVELRYCEGAACP